MNKDEVALRGARMGINIAAGKPPIRAGNVVTMAILFGAVKRQVQAQRMMEQKNLAAQMAGERAFIQENAAREQNLDRMRQQTKAQLALSMGMSPVMMGGGIGAGDATVAAHIAQSASMKGLGMV